MVPFPAFSLIGCSFTQPNGEPVTVSVYKMTPLKSEAIVVIFTNLLIHVAIGVSD
jgi:hypothetical protein